MSYYGKVLGALMALFLGALYLGLTSFNDVKDAQARLEKASSDYELQAVLTKNAENSLVELESRSGSVLKYNESWRPYIMEHGDLLSISRDLNLVTDRFDIVADGASGSLSNAKYPFMADPIPAEGYSYTFTGSYSGLMDWLKYAETRYPAIRVDDLVVQSRNSTLSMEVRVWFPRFDANTDIETLGSSSYPKELDGFAIRFGRVPLGDLDSVAYLERGGRNPFEIKTVAFLNEGPVENPNAERAVDLQSYQSALREIRVDGVSRGPENDGVLLFGGLPYRVGDEIRVASSGRRPTRPILEGVRVYLKSIEERSAVMEVFLDKGTEPELFKIGLEEIMGYPDDEKEQRIGESAEL